MAKSASDKIQDGIDEYEAIIQNLTETVSELRAVIRNQAEEIESMKDEIKVLSADLAT